MPSYTSSQWVPFQVELVFAFFANPSNLPHLTPKWQRARVEELNLVPPPARPLAVDPALRFQSPAAGAGSELSVSMRLVPGLPMRAGWQLTIAEFAWNDHFTDVLLKGPFKSWRHTHRIVRDAGHGTEEGTRITDELSYELPLGPLGSLANSLFVHRQIEATFAYRRQRLMEILPVAARQATRRE